jgi:hypothetical protein
MFVLISSRVKPVGGSGTVAAIIAKELKLLVPILLIAAI